MGMAMMKYMPLRAFMSFGGMTLEVTGTNTLQSGVARAGIEVQSGATLEIGGGGVLEAFGGEEGAGIVGGTVRIVSGTMRVRGDGPTSDFVTEETRILGGSVLPVLGRLSPAASNNIEQVYCVTVPGLSPSAPVTLEGLDGYGTDGIVADESGSVYLWLTNGIHFVTANGVL